jgi:hypothetical protein
MCTGSFLAHALEESIFATAAPVSLVPGCGTHVRVVRVDGFVRVRVAARFLAALLPLALVRVGDCGIRQYLSRAVRNMATYQEQTRRA